MLAADAELQAVAHLAATFARDLDQDTLPAYEHPTRDQVLQQLQTPVGERSDAYLLRNRIDDIASDLATGWRVDVRQ